MNDAGNKRAVTLLAETDAAIGGFAATNVAFAGGAASDVALSTKSATTNCILKETFDLTWKAVVSNGTDVVTNTLGRTDGHVLYTILGEPVEPWNNTKITNQNAWASALDVVCSNGWAKGCTNCDDAASTITKAIFDSNCFRYDTSNGAIRLMSATGKFRLSHSIEVLNKRRKAWVNCADCARMTTSFANLTGCELSSSRMGYSFRLNPITAIGTSPWTPPNWGWGFNYHEVAWAGLGNDGDKVFDACLQLDGDDNPSSGPHSPMYAANIIFSDGSAAPPLVYRERLSAPGVGGYGQCIARPTTKHRYEIE